MQKLKEKTFEDYCRAMHEAAKTLTQDQINACAWVMHGDASTWTKERIIEALPIFAIVKNEEP